MMCGCYNGFNPTLVRLALAYRLDVYNISMFQSHLGSISTTSFTSEGEPWQTFQSHLGSISTRVFDARQVRPVGFQSHLGSISTEDRANARLSRHSVSIPPWFD